MRINQRNRGSTAANKFQIIPVSDVENSFDKMHKKAISSCRQIEIYARSRCR